jgi:hypothetical protein
MGTPFYRLRDALDLEREVDYRIAQLLVWLDNHNAWVYLGCEGVLQFGESIEIGMVVAWIFNNEEKGYRIK